MRNLYTITTDQAFEMLLEGVNINPRKREIEFTTDHERNVITGNEQKVPKPIYSKFRGHTHISIFKRLPSKDVTNDASPVIYALKHEEGWHFKSVENLKQFFKQFIRITRELNQNFDTIAIVPSSNRLNSILLKYIGSQLKCKNLLEKYLFKLTKGDVFENCIDWDLLEEDHINTDFAEKDFKKFFSKMPGNTFRYHDIPVTWRQYIKNIFYFPEEDTVEYAKYFNGKKVLIIDDTIATGKSVSDTIDVITQTYDCKSITILTLFSKL